MGLDVPVHCFLYHIYLDVAIALAEDFAAFKRGSHVEYGAGGVGQSTRTICFFFISFALPAFGGATQNTTYL